MFFGYYISMKYDVAIIGAGPAGLTAGIFASRAGLKCICFEKVMVGGQASLSGNVENFPGTKSIAGYELMQQMADHATSVGVQLMFEDVLTVKQNKASFSIKTKKETYIATKVIIASGCKTRKLGIENEKQFIGKGVSYCASCDGNFFKDSAVAVVGGGNSAVENVNYLSRLCSKVYMLNRSEKFRANKHEIEKLSKLKNVEILTNTTVERLNGNEKLENLEILHQGKQKILKVSGLFIAIGYEPDLSFLDVDVELDDFGYIKTNENQETNIKNLFACGDITSKQFKQIITACADGARAGNSCIGG